MTTQQLSPPEAIGRGRQADATQLTYETKEIAVKATNRMNTMTVADLRAALAHAPDWAAVEIITYDEQDCAETHDPHLTSPTPPASSPSTWPDARRPDYRLTAA